MDKSFEHIIYFDEKYIGEEMGTMQHPFRTLKNATKYANKLSFTIPPIIINITNNGRDK